MIERAHWSAAALGAIAMCCLVMGGCAGVRHAKTDEPVPTTTAPVEVIEVIEVAEPPVVPPPGTVTTPPPTLTAPTAVAAPPAPTPPPPQVTAPKPPAIAAVPPPQVVPGVPKAPVPVASRPVPAPLDLESLGTRLKQTRAIGVLTKLSLKNQVDDLLQKFRAYHRQQGTATLPELRRSYDLLMLKVLSLLQDSDPPLARDIVQSRAAIWGILADPRKFNEASLMAGATT